MATWIKAPNVAGAFYPNQVVQLKKQIQHFLDSAQVDGNAPVRMVLVPHAGYQYSASYWATPSKNHVGTFPRLYNLVKDMPVLNAS